MKSTGTQLYIQIAAIYISCILSSIWIQQLYTTVYKRQMYTTAAYSAARTTQPGSSVSRNHAGIINIKSYSTDDIM